MSARPAGIRLLVAALALVVLAIAGGVAFLALGYWNNNRDAAMPAHADLARSRDRAIEWLRTHEAEVIAIDNPALWWMVRESATRSNSAYLAELYGRYYERNLAHRPTNFWHHLFDENSSIRVPLESLDDWPDYNLLFLYGLSCQPALKEYPRVKPLLQPDACGAMGSPRYFRDPACITHQLMGIRFLQAHRCSNPEQVAELVAALQDRIEVRAAWDFRMVDFHIQRSLMLAESGAGGRIRARWLERILAAQRLDGGWDDFDELVGLGDTSVGWSGRSLRLRKPESNFHTTAQGLYLMTLLAQTSQDGAR